MQPPNIQSLISSIRAGSGETPLVPTVIPRGKGGVAPATAPQQAVTGSQPPVAVPRSSTQQGLRLGPIDYHPAVGLHVRVL